MVLLGNKITKQLIYKFLGIFVVGVIVLGIATYVFLIQREKSQFAQAEKEIDALYAQIVQKVGKPDQEKKTKSCGYASRVYERGPRSCGISSGLLYKRTNADQSNSKMNDLGTLVGTKLYDGLVLTERYSFTNYDGVGPDQSFSQVFNTKSSLSCSVQYEYPVLPSLFKDFQDTQGENFAVNISCGGPAMAEHYPVTKD